MTDFDSTHRMIKQFIKVKAGVRYWEDARVNGVEDADGTLIPFREGDDWCPVIEVESGRIVDWPAGMVADIHYKVCDDGEYWILDGDMNQLGKYPGDYVPDCLACGDDGHGDYIIMKVGADGKIEDWSESKAIAAGWVPVKAVVSTDFDGWWADYRKRHERSGIKTGFDDLERMANEAWQAAQSKWRPIETAPKGLRILVVTEKNVPFVAKYILPRTHEAYSDSALDWAEWDEMSDTPWCPEGWYMEVDCELCEVDYHPYAGLPLTRWMPLPAPPEQ